MWPCWAGPRGELAEQEFFSLAQLVDAFDITGISKSPAIFDLEKLKYFNSAYIKDLSAEDFLAAATPISRKGSRILPLICLWWLPWCRPVWTP